ncbi:hypothetical protein KAW18_13645, partial [candidate division WOR-3 bacterium]|nr:hypothetical protein [candidate division WOR-3 bacterium]
GEGPGDTATGMRSSFKIDDIAWAWREYWKDIERDKGKGGVILNFVNFIRPEYYFDCEKTEHRLITDEGNINIIFTAPRQEEGSNNFKYPEISIEGGVPRKFKITYDNYNDEQIEWMDEGGDGVEDGSGGKEEKSIYEEAMGSDWFHDDNTMFDENASAEKSDNRKIILSKDSLLGDTVSWYNRGLIADIPKNRLIYLPYEEEITEDYILKFNRSSVNMIWYNTAVFSDEIIFSITPSIFPFCITRVDVFGYAGTKESKDFCRPEITIAEYGKNDTGGEGDDIPDFPPTILYTNEGIRAKNVVENDFYVKAELNRFPIRMMYAPTNIQIKFTMFTGQHLELYKVDLYISKYIDAEEEIKVWEQKYIVSTGEFGD